MNATEDNEDDDRDGHQMGVDALCIHRGKNRQQNLFFFGGERATDVDSPRKSTKRTQNRTTADSRPNDHDDFSSWSSSYYYYYWMYSAYNTSNGFLQRTHLDALCIHGQFEGVEK